MCEAAGGNVEKAKDLVVISEVVHNGTLMVDDVEDDSEMRRGKPCIHKLYGVDIAVNAGNAMYFIPLLVLMKNKEKFEEKMRLKAFEIYSQEMINLSFGQAFDIYWHKGRVENVTEEQYLQMCAYKTGTLARMSAKLGALVGGANEKQIDALGKFAEAIGVAFQIQDDILSLSGEEFAKGKGKGEDIHEGKRTLIVIHCLKNASPEKAKRLREILNMHTFERKLIEEAIEIIEETGSIEYAREFAKKMVNEAWSEADNVLKESPAKEKLKAFADYLVERKI